MSRWGGRQRVSVGIGERVGPFEILDVLGAGGMGAVLRARHAATGQLVALKMVRTPDHRLVASIRREIHALSQLEHPGIVRVLETGIHERVPWYAMELVSGTPLRRSHGTEVTPDAATVASPMPGDGAASSPGRSPGTPPPVSSPAELRAVLEQVRSLCAPLGYMHGEGLVHRDLKPGNVMRRADGSVVIIDFGLTSRFGGDVSRDALEVGGLVVGTVLYMSPEQGRGELVDARSDLYALGCMLYELLTGRPPFIGTVREVLRSHEEVTPEPPSRFASIVPAGLDRLVLDLLSKAPRDRLGYADDVARRIGELGGLPPATAPGPAGKCYLYRPGLAGRAREVERLVAAVRGVPRRQGAVFLVGGESGIGKTRLMTEVLAVASASRVPILTGQARPDGGEPLELLRGPLLGVADRCLDGRVVAEAVVGARGPLLARYEPALARLPGQALHAPPAELSADAARLRLHAALRETLLAFSAPAGLVMVLDDLQWADELSLGFLRELAHVASRERILVLATFRSDEVHPPLQELLDDGNVERVQLGNLDAGAVESMVRDMLSMPSPPPRFSHFLWSQSEGSPFFVAEYLRAAVAHGILRRDGEGAWRVGQDGDVAADATISSLGLPRSIQELVERRLAGLQGVPARLLDAATVLGREMPATLLLEVAGTPGTEGLAALSTLLARQVLEEVGPEVRFVHDKIREVRRGSLGPAVSRPLHRAAAERLTALGQEDGLPRHAERAHHWEQCGEDAAALPCYLAAARAAAARVAHDDAARHYDSYLRLAAGPSSESVTALLELCALLGLRGRAADAEPLRLRALEDARAIGDGRLEVRAMNDLGRAWMRSGSPARARAILQEALALAIREADLDGEARTLWSLGVVAVETGGADEARPCFERQLELRRQQGDRVGEAEAAYSLADLLSRSYGRPLDAVEPCQFALDVARAAGERSLEASILGGLSSIQASLGRTTEALETCARGASLAREIGHRRLEANLTLNVGAILAQQGRAEEAIASFERTLLIFREIHDRRGEGSLLTNLAAVHARLERFDVSRALTEQALAIHREMGDRRFEGLALGNLALVDARLGELDGACASLEAAAARAREVGDRDNEGAWLVALAEILVLSGDHPRAEELLRQADALLSEARGLPRRGFLFCLRGHLALARGSSAAGDVALAKEIATQLDTREADELGVDIARLERARAALAGGRPLANGFLFDELPPGQQRWFREHRPGLAT